MKFRLFAAGFILAAGLARSLQGQEEHPNRATGLRGETLYSQSGADDINLFNGNLVYRVPVGEPVAVGPQLSIAPVLVYNTVGTRAWRRCKDQIEAGAVGDRAVGAGWQLHFGRLVPVRNNLPVAPPSDECAPIDAPVEDASPGPVTTMISRELGYQDPDGAVHEFFDRFAEPSCEVGTTGCDPTPPPSCTDPTTHCFYYTHDGSYLRLDPHDPEHGAMPTVYFPDGTFRVLGFTFGRYPIPGSHPPDLLFADTRPIQHTTVVGDQFGNQFTVQYYGDNTPGSPAHPLAAYGVPQNEWDTLPYRVFPSTPSTPYTPLYPDVVFRFDVDTYEYQPDNYYPAVRAPRLTKIVTPTAVSNGSGGWRTAEWVLGHPSPARPSLSSLTLPTLAGQGSLAYGFSYSVQGVSGFAVQLPSNGQVVFKYGSFDLWAKQPSIYFYDGAPLWGFSRDTVSGVTERTTYRAVKTGISGSAYTEESRTVYARSYLVEDACSESQRENCRLRVDVWSPRVDDNEPYKVTRTIFGESDQTVNTPLYGRPLEIRDYSVTAAAPNRAVIDAATPFRTTVFTYAFDGPTNSSYPPEGIGRGTSHNTREVTRDTYWAGKWSRIARWDWDDYGHWGTTRDYEDGVEVKRTLLTHLNKVCDSPTGAKWILDPVSTRTIERDPDTGLRPDPAGANLTTTEEFYHDSDGFPWRDVVGSNDAGDSRVRTTTRVRGTATAAPCRPGGAASIACANLGRASSQTVSLSGSLNTSDLTGGGGAVPVSSSHQQSFYYAYGTLAAANDSGMSFLTVDRDVAPTGKVVGYRGPEGRRALTDTVPTLTTKIVYDLLGRVVSTTPPGEGAEEITYTAQSTLRVKNLGAAGRSRVFFDQLGRPTVELRQMPAASWAYRIRSLDAAGRDAGMTEWQSRTCASTADPCPELLNLQASIDTTTHVSTPAGTVSYDFDEIDRARGRRLADGSIFEDSYQGWWQQASTRRVKTALGNASASVYTYEHDAPGRLIRVVEPATVSADGLAMNPAEETTYVYDAQDRLIRVDKAGSDEHATSGSTVTQTRTWRYDDFGWLVAQSDPEANAVTESRDSRGLPLRTWDGMNRIFRTYDGAGRHLTSEREGEEPPYDWDGQDARWYEVFAYDGLPGFDFGRSNGRLVWSIRANHAVSNGGTVDFGWFGTTNYFHYTDTYGRLRFRQQSDLLMPEPASPGPYSIGTLGSAAEKRAPLADAMRKYFEDQGRKGTKKADLFKAASSEKAAAAPVMDSASSPSGVARWTYTWDTAGRIRAITYPRRDEGFATSVSTTFDGEWPVTVSATFRDPFLAATVDTVNANLSYGPSGHVTSTEVRSAGGSTLGFRLDTPDETSGLPRPGSWSFYTLGLTTLREQRNYSYDPSGNIASISSWVPPGATVTDTYLYDSRGRLVRDSLASRAVNPQSREYDGFGNPVRVTGADAATLTTARATNRLSPDLALYDPAGRMTEDAGRNIARDYYPDGALTAETSHAEGSTASIYPSGDSAWLLDGRAEVALSFWGDAMYCQTEYFASSLRDEGARLLTEYRGEPIDPNCSCATGCSFQDRYSMDVARLGPYAVATYKRGTGIRLEARDHLGTPRIVTNAAGTGWSSVRLDSFGLELSANGLSRERFTGHERNHRSGDGNLLPISDYMHARTYVPMFGRFTRPDPASSFSLFDPQSLNRYAYARNNPLKYVDPDGRAAVLSLVPPSLVVGGMVATYAVALYYATAGPYLVNNARVTTAPDFFFGSRPGLSQSVAYPGSDPTLAPGSEWEWRGKGARGSRQGSWYKPGTGESLHPDLEHGAPVGPHWDYVDSEGNQWRLYPDGTKEPKDKGGEKPPAKPETSAPKKEEPPPEDPSAKIYRMTSSW